MANRLRYCPRALVSVLLSVKKIKERRLKERYFCAHFANKSESIPHKNKRKIIFKSCKVSIFVLLLHFRSAWVRPVLKNPKMFLKMHHIIEIMEDHHCLNNNIHLELQSIFLRYDSMRKSFQTSICSRLLFCLLRQRWTSKPLATH